MYPVLLTLGPITIYSFGLLLSLGLLLGIYYVWKHGRSSNLSEEKLLDSSILVMLGGLLGARLLYVSSNWASFSDDWWVTFQFWRGGLSFWGALLGGVVTILILAKRWHWPAGSLFDLAAPATAIGAALGYIGAFLNGSAYGAETSLPWGVRLLGLSGTRHPSQLLEAGLQVGILLLLLKIRSRSPFSGFLALTYLVVYSFGRLVLESLRGDSTYAVGPFTQAQLLGLLVGVASILLIYLRLARLQGSWRVSIRRILVRST